MVFENLGLSGLVLITPKVFHDSRGFFFESYNHTEFKNHKLNVEFLQDNQSVSHKNTIRGLHFQNPPFEQGKLVRVITGMALDVVVDIRKKSPTYGKHYSIILKGNDNKMLWIPPGFAHGFATLEDNTVFFYKCTAMYNKESESGIKYDDPQLGINWGIENPVLSGKDLELKNFSEADIRF